MPNKDCFKTFIGLFMLIIFSGSLLPNVKVCVDKRNYKYGEKLIIPVVVENHTMDTIEVDTQPFYLLAIGSKGGDSIEVYNSNRSNLNKIYIAEETCGGIRFNHIDGHLVYTYSDTRLRRTAKLKSKDKIKLKLVLEWNLYHKYLEKGLWEVNVVVAWQKSQNIDKDIDQKINNVNCVDSFVIPVVKNYYSFFIKNKPIGKNMKKSLFRSYFLSACESGVFKMRVE